MPRLRNGVGESCLCSHRAIVSCASIRFRNLAPRTDNIDRKLPEPPSHLQLRQRLAIVRGQSAERHAVMFIPFRNPWTTHATPHRNATGTSP